MASLTSLKNEGTNGNFHKMNACMLLEKLILIRSRLITNYIYATIQKICIKVMKTFIRERRNTLFKSDNKTFIMLYIYIYYKCCSFTHSGTLTAFI